MRTATPAFLAAVFAASFGMAGAQAPVTSAMPRAAVDTSHGIMLALEQFAEGIRRGELDVRSYRSPELMAALGALTRAAHSRTFKSPDPSLGPLSDFRFDSVQIDRTPKDKDVVTVKARAILTSDRGGARAVVVHFRHLYGNWVPVQLDGFLAYLEAQSKRYARTEAP